MQIERDRGHADCCAVLRACRKQSGFEFESGSLYRQSHDLLIEEAFAFEDVGHEFADAGFAGFGLFGSGEMIDVGALAAGSQGFKGFLDVGEFVEHELEFFGELEIGGLL
jgi:hypothetical protein